WTCPGAWQCSKRSRRCDPCRPRLYPVRRPVVVDLPAGVHPVVAGQDDLGASVVEPAFLAWWAGQWFPPGRWVVAIRRMSWPLRRQPRPENSGLKYHWTVGLRGALVTWFWPFWVLA